MPAASKALLRNDILARRGTISPAVVAAFAQRIATIGGAMAADLAAKTVAAYWPIKDEASPLLLLEALAAQGRATALPVMAARDAPLVFRRWRPGEPLHDVSFGLKEPAADAPMIVPNLVFVPLVAFDRHGYRLGYGAGFYDRTLAKLRAKGVATAVGLAYALQELPEIPAESHDQKLDYVLTDREWIDCRNGTSHASSFRR
jgi:5-formyltetrahydrofolate cyclo-ligase